MGEEKTGAWHVLPRRCDVKVCYFGSAGKKRNGSEQRFSLRLVSGSGSDPRPFEDHASMPDKIAGSSPPRSGYCASWSSKLQQLSVYLPIRPREIPPKKGTPSASGKRQASALPREGIPPCPHYLTIAILIPFRYFRFKSLGNINHNSRTEPHTNHAERSLTLPNAPAERPTGRPISFSEQHPGAGCTGTRFPAADQRGESLRGNGVLLGAFHSRAGLEPADKTELGRVGGCCTVRHGTFKQRLNLIRSATVRHREKQTVPSASCASARCTVPSHRPLELTTRPPGELIDQIRLRVGTFSFPAMSHRQHDPGQRPTCASSWG